MTNFYKKSLSETDGILMNSNNSRFEALFEALHHRDGCPHIITHFILDKKKINDLSQRDLNLTLFFGFNFDTKQLFVQKNDVFLEISVQEYAYLRLFVQGYNTQFTGEGWDLGATRSCLDALEYLGVKNEMWHHFLDYESKRFDNELEKNSQLRDLYDRIRHEDNLKIVTDNFTQGPNPHTLYFHVLSETVMYAQIGDLNIEINGWEAHELERRAMFKILHNGAL